MSETVDIEPFINGTARQLSVPARRLLADVLRDDLGLVGTRLGCEHGVCGACTVLIDGRAARSCLMLAAQAHGAQVQTIEGLAGDRYLDALQAAFHQHHALQCGFCTSGMLVSAVELLRENPEPTVEEIKHHLSGNICRCTGYGNIVAAVQHAARLLSGAATRPVNTHSTTGDRHDH
jgi:carbon-monoxide dehydrogenase small subunit